MFAVEKSPPASPEITEEERHAGRREVRERMAQHAVANDRYRLQQRTVASLDARADGAVATHAAACLPLQTRLTEVEAAIARHLSDREPLPPELESERVELLEQVAHENEALEAALAPLQAARLREQRELDRLGIAAGEGAAAEAALTRPPLANPELLVDKFVAEQSTTWSERRLRAGEEQLRTAVKALAGIRNAGKKTDLSWSGHAVARGVDGEALAKAQWRVKKWTREVETARDACVSASQAGRNIHQALLDE